ncbi:lipase 3-like [Melitaea cinxia]|uniref:lipase 3-like n=1 Tax=Melitaea cinxia TaxID=113334 RepID=UPI001E27311A|nr:lipase 3-like [Melitaea cinxia]
MKAVYFLFCLALAYHCTANIVRHQFQPRLDKFLIQPPGPGYERPEQRQSESTSQSQESEESKESKKKRSYDNVDFLSENRNWFSSWFSVNKQVEKTPYGDVIDWQGIQYAAGPKSPVKNEKEIEKIFKDAYKTLEHLSEEEKRMIHAAFGPEGVAQAPSVRANATELLRSNQYEVEEHVVKTNDGYFLTVFRIQPKEQEQRSSEEMKRPVVLLMHGIVGSADDWLLLGPKMSLAYMLADLGYEVWLGNTRGNKYARRHASKHESNPDFWQYSIDEIATNDVPAIIDYTLKTSEQEKLYYVGHSQGNTAFFAFMAALPHYKEKVAMMFALSPMVYMTNVRSPFFKMISPTSAFFESLHEQLGNGEFKIGKDLLATVGGNMCQKEVGCRHICSNLNFVITGADTTGIEFAMLPSIVSHLPAGASTRNIRHIGQGVASHEFRKYDYGSNVNSMIYGQSEPPKYNLTKVEVPVVLYYSEEDWLAHPKDVERLQKELPNVVDTFKVPEKHFSHMEFQFSEKAPELIYNRVIEAIAADTTSSKTN